MRTTLIDGPRGSFRIPAEPDAVRRHVEASCRSVFDGEYSYPRKSHEDVRTLLDVGCNVGAFLAWAFRWWPSLRIFTAYDPNIAALRFAKENANAYGNVLHRAVTAQSPPVHFVRRG